jgi:hypothetical protein
MHKCLFVYFLPELGREVTHGLFFVFINIKLCLKINYFHFVYNKTAEISMLHCSILGKYPKYFETVKAPY